MIIIKDLLLLLLLFGHITLASADNSYSDALQSYERQEYRQAVQIFDRLATTGDAYAQFMLGRLHETGNGTPQNFVQAYKWYNLAAARGHRHAAEARDSLTNRMTARQIAEAQQAASAWQAETSRETSSDRQDVAEIQRELNRLGYDAGPVDGAMGSRTRNAIRAYQADRDMAQNGQVTPGLLQRLRQTEKQEVAAVATASPRIALEDDFRDGNYSHNPSWMVLSGDFEVDENGLRSIVETRLAADRESSGLSSDRPEEIGLAMLNLVLKQTSDARRDEAPTPVEPARIFANAAVDNAFRMELELASREQPGSLELGLFQGNRPNGNGYRLVYSAGSRPGLILVRLTSGSIEVVARHEGRLDLEDGRFHRIVWTRDENGRMQVHVDGQRLLRVQDNALRNRFQGVMLANQGGDYSVRRVRLQDQ